jgi:hypothetical protein
MDRYGPQELPYVLEGIKEGARRVNERLQEKLGEV